MKLTERSDSAHQKLTFENEFDPFKDKFKLEDMQANFAFGLWSNTWNPLNLTDIEDYVKLEASLVNRTYIPGVGPTVTYEPLGLHFCNGTDNFFEPLEAQEKFIPVVKATAYCLNNAANLMIWGNSDSAASSNI